MMEHAGTDIDALFDAARAAQARAYAPYSNFQVGSAIMTADGAIFAGCNVENASYPVGTCAEAGAVAAMIAGGGNHIAAIAIVGSGKTPCFPCGACRQRIAEFASAGALVHAGSSGSPTIETVAIAALLPHAFGAGSLL